MRQTAPRFNCVCQHISHQVIALIRKCFLVSFFKLKKDIDLEKAGLQFIPYQELQATVCEKSEDAEEDSSDEGKVEKTDERTVEGVQEAPGCDDGQQQQQEEEEASRLVENIKISDPRRGTEVKLLGLRFGENTATVVAQQITVCLQCNR